MRTGPKDVVRVRCASGRQIKVTPDHRLLTTDGYLEVGEMRVGETELITQPMISDSQREARRATMTRWSRRRNARSGTAAPRSACGVPGLAAARGQGRAHAAHARAAPG